MLILILIEVQHLHNVVCSFEKLLNRQNHSPSDSHHCIKKISSSKVSRFRLPLHAIWKTLGSQVVEKKLCVS